MRIVIPNRARFPDLAIDELCEVAKTMEPTARSYIAVRYAIETILELLQERGSDIEQFAVYLDALDKHEGPHE